LGFWVRELRYHAGIGWWSARTRHAHRGGFGLEQSRELYWGLDQPCRDPQG
jgi:hypothetical protein